MNQSDEPTDIMTTIMNKPETNDKSEDINRVLTENEMKYYSVLKKEHSDWKQELERFKLAATEIKDETVQIEVNKKQKKKFLDDIFELEASCVQIEKLDGELANLVENLTCIENKLSLIYSKSITNIYKRIEQKMSTCLILN